MTNMFENQNTGFGFNNNAQALPVPADSLMRQPQSINVNNPPFVPQGIECTPELQQCIPQLSGMLAYLISNSASQNHLRAFAFNLLSSNNFANAEFNALVATGMQIVMVCAYMQNQRNDLPGLLQYAAQKALEMYISVNVSRYPALQQYVDQNQANQIRQVLSEFEQFKNASGQLMRQMQFNNNQFNQPSMGGFNSGFNNNNFGGGFNNQPSSFNRFSNFNQGGFNTRVGMSPSHFGSPSATEASVFQSSMREAGNTVNEQASYQSSRFSSLRESLNQSTPQRNEVMTDVANSSQIPVVAKEQTPIEPVMKPYKESGLTWVRSDEQPYPPIVKYSTHEIVAYQNEKGEVRLAIQNRKGGRVFDYEAHTTLSSLRVYPVSETKPSEVEIQSVQEDLNTRINEERALTVTNNDSSQMNDSLDYDLVKYDDISIEKSVEGAILTNDVNREFLHQLRGTDYTALVKTESKVVESLGPLDEVAKTETKFLSRIKILSDLRDRLRENRRILTKRAWRVIESRLTKGINHVLKNQLSLTLQIDSFFEDYNDLKDAIQNVSPVLLQAFLNYQSEIIILAMNFAQDEVLIDSIREELVLKQDLLGEEKIASFEFLQTDVIIYGVDIDSLTLDIDLFNNTGSLILQSESAVLFKLVNLIFSSTQSPYREIYLSLSDGVVLRLDRGLVGTNNYLVSVFKK